MLKKVFYTVGISAFLFTSCYNDKEELLYPSNTNTCDTVNVGYTAVIKPIVASNCAYSGCHSGTSAAAGINLDDHAGLSAIVSSNRLLGTINHLSGYSAMPKNANKMSDCNIAKITAWVNKGAPNN